MQNLKTTGTTLCLVYDIGPLVSKQAIADTAIWLTDISCAVFFSQVDDLVVASSVKCDANACMVLDWEILAEKLISVVAVCLAVGKYQCQPIVMLLIYANTV